MTTDFQTEIADNQMCRKVKVGNQEKTLRELAEDSNWWIVARRQLRPKHQPVIWYKKGTPDEQKRCGDCLELKPPAAYDRHASEIDCKQRACKKCKSVKKFIHDVNKQNDEAGISHRVSEAEVKAAIERAEGRCGICECDIEYGSGSRDSRAVIDHCHTTGRVRGILCHHCNLFEGNGAKSSTKSGKSFQELGRRADEYRRRFQT